MSKGQGNYAGQYRGTSYTSIADFFDENTPEDIYLKMSKEPIESFNEANWLLSQQWDLDYLQQVQGDLWPLLVHVDMARNFILGAVYYSDIHAVTILWRTNWQKRSSHESELGEFHVLRLRSTLDKMPSLLQNTTMNQKMKNTHHHLSKHLQTLLGTYLTISMDNKKKICPTNIWQFITWLNIWPAGI